MKHGGWFFFLLWGLGAAAAYGTLYTTDGTVADTQAKINTSANGDTVQLPLNGSFTWSGGVTISGKGITFDLNGSTLTRGTGTTTFIAVTNNTGASTRVTNGTMVQNVTGAFLVTFDGSFTSQFFRLDHCTLTGGSGTGGQFLVNTGQAWGVIDHCTLAAPTNSEMIHNSSYGAGNTTGWYDTVTAGGVNAVYIEGNSFTNNNVSGNPAYYFGNSAMQGYYGCRTVFRYNSLYMSQVDQHGGTISARWWEVYENTFTVATNGNQSSYADLRGGSGVVFNNYLVGTNLGSGAIHLGPDVGGDDNTYHVGLGKALVSDPAYVWNNAAGMTVTDSAPVVLNTDYFKSAKAGYTAYVYPYPWSALTTPTVGTAAALSSVSIQFTWTYTGPALETFTIQRSTNNSTWSTDGTAIAGATSYNSVGLANGTLYYYRVAAVDSNGTSSYSASASATTQAGVASPINTGKLSGALP